MKLKRDIARQFCICFCLLLIPLSGKSQIASPFKIRFQKYIKGDMALISNQIVNRVDSRKNSTPYNEVGKKAKLNDEFEMAYIDIDTIETTFSSSSATLSLNNPERKKIIYAGLYWSATYKYASGIRNRKWKYNADDNSRFTIDSILIQLPGKKNYQTIVGEIIFDGLNQKNFAESAPYAVYADVTPLVQELENPNGEYIVANIKATQGKLSGGVAGGWSLFLVYEDTTETAKFITSYDGFAGITTKPVEIQFTGFNTLPKGKVNAKLAFAALEGDEGLDGDRLEIKSGNQIKYTSLAHPLKPETNFFNSTLIAYEDYFTERNPNSRNTLGYDAGLLNINNINNSVIENNTSKISLKLKSTGDRYTLFFTALNVEIVENLISNTSLKAAKNEYSNSDLVTPNPNPKNENKGMEFSNEDKSEMHSEKVDSKPDSFNEVTKIPLTYWNEISEKFQKEKNHTKKLVLAGKPVSIPKTQKGFYVVANVFAYPYNANRFYNYLNSIGLNPKILYNPNTKLRSVYLERFDTWEEALLYYYTDAQGKYKESLWIMIVSSP